PRLRLARRDDGAPLRGAEVVHARVAAGQRLVPPPPPDQTAPRRGAVATAPRLPQGLPRPPHLRRRGQAAGGRSAVTAGRGGGAAGERAGTCRGIGGRDRGAPVFLTWFTPICQTTCHEGHPRILDHQPREAAG